MYTYFLKCNNEYNEYVIFKYDNKEDKLYVFENNYPSLSNVTTHCIISFNELSRNKEFIDNVINKLKEICNNNKDKKNIKEYNNDPDDEIYKKQVMNNKVKYDEYMNITFTDYSLIICIGVNENFISNEFGSNSYKRELLEYDKLLKFFESLKQLINDKGKFLEEYINQFMIN